MSFLEDGKRVEYQFARDVRNRNHPKFCDIVFATSDQDMHEHWDLKVVTTEADYKCDVKAQKKVNRHDAEPTSDIHWLEIKNVNGDPGWIYGKADYIVFQNLGEWILVKPDKLKEMVTRFGSRIHPTKELYKPYQRPGRKDVIVMVRTDDLLARATMVMRG